MLRNIQSHLQKTILTGILLMASLFCNQGQPHAEEIIKIGYFMLPPQAYLKEGKVTGTAVEYWEKHIAPEMGVKIKWYGPYNLKRLLFQAKKGKIDAILVLAKNAERKKVVNYPQHGFYKMSAGVLLLKKHEVSKINSFNDLQNLQLCFFAGAHIPLPLKMSRIKWKLEYGSDWTKQCLDKTMLKNVDATFSLMSLSLEYSSRLYKLKQHLHTVLIPGLDMPVYTAFSRKAPDTLISRYNTAHNKFMKENRFDKIISEFLKEK